MNKKLFDAEKLAETCTRAAEVLENFRVTLQEALRDYGNKGEQK